MIMNDNPIIQLLNSYTYRLNSVNYEDYDKNVELAKRKPIYTEYFKNIESNITDYELLFKKKLDITDYKWHATTLKPNYKDSRNTAFGDDYGMIRNNPKSWSYGADNTGDITKAANIKYYKDKFDSEWYIGDCGIPWDPEGEELFVRLYLAEILFILYNGKKGCNCIFTPFDI
jgi:hypothetical protein